MTSSRPYLLRAIHEWIVDNQLTPYLLVDAQAHGVEVPRQYVSEGKIVLNVAPMAVAALQLGNDAVTFNARFGGQPMLVHVPVAALLAIYAKENGRGMVFTDEDGGGPPPQPDQPKSDTPKAGQPRLRVVK